MKKPFFNIKHCVAACLLALTLGLLSATANASGSNTLSQGSAMISQGSLTLGEGASEVLGEASSAAVAFTVDIIEVVGDVATVSLHTSAKASEQSAKVAITLSAASVTSLAIAAGSVIEIMVIYAENNIDVLGYVLLEEAEVMLFVSAVESTLASGSQTL